MNTALIVVSAVVLLLLVLLLTPVTVRVKYEDELSVYAGYGFSIKLYPSKKKKDKKTVKKKTKKKAEAKASKKDKNKLSIDEIISLVKIALNAVKRFLSALRIPLLKLNLVISGSDAAKAAINYGNVCMAVSTLYPVLEGKRKKRIKKSDIFVDLDYTGKSSAELDIIVSAMLLRIIIIALAAGFAILKQLSINEKKGGQKQ